MSDFKPATTDRGGFFPRYRMFPWRAMFYKDDGSSQYSRSSSSSSDLHANDRISISRLAWEAADSLDLDRPWFSTEIPQELLQIIQDVPHKIRTILRLAYLEYNSKRTTALANNMDVLEEIPEIDNPRKHILLPLWMKIMALKMKNPGLHFKPSDHRVNLFKKVSMQLKSKKETWLPIASDTGMESKICTTCRRHLPRKSKRAPCGHLYCSTCIVRKVLISMGNETLWPLRCCEQEIPVAFFKQALSRSQLRQFRAKAKEYATPVENRFYCRNKKCKKFFASINTTRELHCPHCKWKMCIHCRKTRHDDEVHCTEDPSFQALVSEAELEDWRSCFNCGHFIEIAGDCPRVQCLCGYKFCWICGGTSPTCLFVHSWTPQYFYEMKKASQIRRRDREDQLDRELMLRRALITLAPDTGVQMTPEDVERFINETSNSPSAIDLQRRFQKLEKAFEALHQAQLDKIQQRNNESINLAKKYRDQTARERDMTEDSLRAEIKTLEYNHLVKKQTLRKQHNTTLRDLTKLGFAQVCTLAEQSARLSQLDAECIADERGFELAFQRDMLPLQTSLEELLSMDPVAWRTQQEEKLEKAENMLRQALMRSQSEERWATLTSSRCLELLKTVEGWEWKAMLRGSYPGAMLRATVINV